MLVHVTKAGAHALMFCSGPHFVLWYKLFALEQDDAQDHFQIYSDNGKSESVWTKRGVVAGV